MRGAGQMSHEPPTRCREHEVDRRKEPLLLVVLGAFLVLAFGTYAVMLTSGAGWVLTGLVGLVFLGAALQVSTSPAAGLLRIALAVLGLVSLVLSISRLLSG